MSLRRTLILASLASALALPALAGGNTILPSYVLRARTVAILVDPNAGVDLLHPNANQDARRDVEAAILNWGRFAPVLSPEDADLVIVIRKGSGKLAQQTLPDPRQNSRPIAVSTSADRVAIGAQHGSQPPSSTTQAGSPNSPSPTDPHPQAEIASPDDSFAVFQGTSFDSGNTDAPLDGPAAWRLIRKDALHPHDVPAVAEFRKAVAEAEKQAAKAAGKHP